MNALVRRKWASVFIALTVGLAAALGVHAAPARAYTYMQCGTGHVKWEYPKDIIYYDNTGGGAYGSALAQATYYWNSASSHISISGGSDYTHLLLGQWAITESNAGNTGYDGYTSGSCIGGYWASSTSQWAVVSSENQYYTDGYNAGGKTQVWVHEMGHGLGLGHSGVLPPCPVPIMYYSSDRYFTCGEQTPQGDDLNGVASLYP